MRLRHFAFLAAIALLAAAAGCRKPAPYAPSAQAAQLDAQLNWTHARLIAVQDGGRYKTLDSFAREWMAMLVGGEHLPGLSPSASLLEWLFNRDAYRDVPLIKLRDGGVRNLLIANLPAEQRDAAAAARRLTPAQLTDPAAEMLLRKLEADAKIRRAINRVREAQAVATRLEEFVLLVPLPGGDRISPWAAPQEVVANLSDEQLGQLGLTRADLPASAQRPLRGLTADQAFQVTLNWSALRAAWLKGDAANVQKYLDQLAGYLPTLAASDVYPSLSQRAAEAKYYAAGKFLWGWLLYFFGLLFGIWAMITRWRVPWLITLVLLLAALAFHAYGLGLRWYILGRIPVANAFESVVAAAWMGIAIALVLELIFRSRVLLVAAHALGFAFLLIGQYMLPGAELGVVPGILDDIQLRLHTVMVICAYALMYVAAIIALIYLVGYYRVWFSRRRLRPDPVLAGVAASPGGGANAMPFTPAEALPADVSPQRPILAGATPGDEAGAAALPAWLNNIDWTHLIILNFIFVLMFVGGVILGAWWADYSWGRPWGWDPKEVFALNTWLVYAILLHVRFVVKNRGLWTAWLSILGCAMMAFNWFYVNFRIESIHSYV